MSLADERGLRAFVSTNVDEAAALTPEMIDRAFEAVRNCPPDRFLAVVPPAVWDTPGFRAACEKLGLTVIPLTSK